MEQAWEAGRSVWPGVTLDRKRFGEFIASRELTSEMLADRASDLYIACACLEGTAGAAEAFRARYLGNLRAYLGTLAAGRDDDFVAEVGQRLAEKLLVGDKDQPPRLSAYAGRGPLEGWVRMAAMRTALDLVRRDPSNRHRDEELVDRALGSMDGELAFMKEQYRQHFIDAFRNALGSVSAQSRALLRLHYLEKVTTGALASLHGVSRPTIVRRLADAREEVLVAVSEHVRERLQVEGSEYESLLDLVRSQIDLSLTGMLRGLQKE
jgi:RNA polymerase sigma-70 factor (ECF subfamily)